MKDYYNNSSFTDNDIFNSQSLIYNQNDISKSPQCFNCSEINIFKPDINSNEKNIFQINSNLLNFSDFPHKSSENLFRIIQCNKKENETHVNKLNKLNNNLNEQTQKSELNIHQKEIKALMNPIKKTNDKRIKRKYKSNNEHNSKKVDDIIKGMPDNLIPFQDTIQNDTEQKLPSTIIMIPKEEEDRNSLSIANTQNSSQYIYKSSDSILSDIKNGSAGEKENELKKIKTYLLKLNSNYQTFHFRDYKTCLFLFNKVFYSIKISQENKAIISLKKKEPNKNEITFSKDNEIFKELVYIRYCLELFLKMKE